MSASLFTPVAPLFAQGPGATGANFLKIPLGARPAALAGAYAALGDDINSIAYNPAGLARLQTQEAALNYNKHFEGVSQSWLAWGKPFPWGTVGAGLNYLSAGSLDAFDANDQPIGSVSASDMALILPYARRLSLRGENLFVGGSFKYITETLSDRKANAYALDLGTILEPERIRGLSLALALENLGTKMKFVNESFALPRNIKLGAGYQKNLGGKFPQALGLSLEVNKPNDNDLYILSGVEYRFFESAALRLGYKTLKSAGSGISFGLGYRLGSGVRMGIISGLSIDYAFADAGSLAGTHRLSLSFRFGKSAQQARRERMEQELEKMRLEQKSQGIQSESKPAPKMKKKGPQSIGP